MDKIETKNDVISQLMQWRDQIGLGFHPDTLGRDYVTGDESPLFTENEANEYDTQIQQCFDACENLGARSLRHGFRVLFPRVSGTSKMMTTNGKSGFLLFLADFLRRAEFFTRDLEYDLLNEYAPHRR